MKNINEIDEVILENDDLEVESTDNTVEGQSEIDEVYPMNGVTINKSFFTVFELKRKYDARPKRIILDSDFQRDDVWGDARQAELVESVLMGLPLPIFYFNQDKFGNLIVVDGRQRLTALFKYMDDEFSLGKIKILTQFRDKKFSELSPIYQTRIEDYQIQAHVILPPTPDRIKFDIFDRVNRGGVQLNKQEIRNALYQGKATRFLNDIVNSNEFVQATGNAFQSEKRMKDKYLINRFIAFFLYQHHQIFEDKDKEYVYKSGIDELLGKGLDTINSMDEKKVNVLKAMTIETLTKSYYYLGSDAFRFTSTVKKSPINMNLFETIMFIMLELDYSLKKERVRKTISKLIDHPDYRDNIMSRRDSAPRLLWRLNTASELGKRIMKND